jgi:hypothetical protein
MKEYSEKIFSIIKRKLGLKWAKILSNNIDNISLNFESDYKLGIKPYKVARKIVENCGHDYYAEYR